jgi:hypothetical protein
MNLPHSNYLEISKLASVFNNTSATYKFYWFISLIEACEEGKIVIGKRELFARMLSNAWYTINYFHLSFGSQDLIQQAIKIIAAEERIPINIRKGNLQNYLANSENPMTVKLLKHFDKNVPHWFLTPWICKNKGENDTVYRNRIYNESQSFFNQELYALYTDRIELNPTWIDFIKSNSKILKDYCYWNLSNFLQIRNPSIPDIPGKLIKPPVRGSLLNQRKNYWDIVFKEMGTIECIYTDTTLHIDKYALDHFVPHAFVSHDLIWNLAPIDVTFNSYKSDKLPDMNFHFNKFYKVQKEAFEIVAQVNPQSKLLEEYIYLFGANHHENKFGYEIFRNTISPLISIAENNGFQKFV